MAPKDPEPSRITWCRALCPLSVFERATAHVKLLGEIISVFSTKKVDHILTLLVPKWDEDGDLRKGDSIRVLVFVCLCRQPRNAQA
jgi:hypothetical protein